MKHDERAAGMKRGGHVVSEPSLRRRDSGRYGPVAVLFNAMRPRCRAPYPHRRPPSLRVRGQGPRRAVPLLGVLALCLIIASMPAMAKTPVILGFGDSLPSGFGLPAAQA